MRLPTALALLLLLLCGACRDASPPPAKGAAAAPEVAVESPLEVATAHRARESSGVLVATLAGRAILLLADSDDHAIRAFDAGTLEPLASTELEGEPRDLVLAYDGSLFVTLPDANLLIALRSAGEDGSLREVARTKTSVEPLAMALTPDEDRVLVVTGASHRLETFDPHTLARHSTIDVAREPRAVLVTSDGAHALVSHAASEEVLLVDLAGVAVEPRIGARAPLGLPPWFTYGPSPPPRSARHAFAIVRRQTPAGERFQIPVAQEATSGASPSGYGATAVTTPAPNDSCGDLFAQFSSTGKSNFDVRTVRPDGSIPARAEARLFLRTECLLPRAAIATADLVLVACEGESEVAGVAVESDGWPMIVRRWTVGRGPSALARLPATSRFVAWSRFARTLSLLELASAGAASAALVSRDVARVRARDPVELTGREIFHRNGDRAISRDGVACASCHPDGRDDGLVWAGPLGSRRSLTLAGNTKRAGAFGWGAEHATLEQHVSETMRRLGGTGLPREQLDPLLSYVTAMKPVPQAAEDAAGDASAAVVARGRQVFDSDRAACGTCHLSAARFSDREPHDVGSGGVFLTPSLVGAGARTTFFHDGRFSSVDDLLAHTPRMGGASLLSPEERAALAAFVRRL